MPYNFEDMAFSKRFLEEGAEANIIFLLIDNEEGKGYIQTSIEPMNSNEV